MKRFLKVVPYVLVAVCYGDDAQVAIPVDGEPLVTYQARPLVDHYAGERFHGSNFIHPLKAPSGFVITESAPVTDHPHHFGLWWPWKHIQVGDRKILCWELQEGDGIVEAQGATRIENGLIGESVYIDRKAPEGPTVRLTERTQITVSDLLDEPVSGYYVDIEITQSCASDQTITVTPYRYSGFSIRGTPEWEGVATYLTSEGIGRKGSNNSRARWVRIEGPTNVDSAHAGILLMSRSSNRSHPEHLRTWEEGRVFVNMNTVQKEAWVLEPDQTYTRAYRLFVYDGKLNADAAEGLWNQWHADLNH